MLGKYAQPTSYFNVNVKIGDKVYFVTLECEENKKVPQGKHAKRGSSPIGTDKNINQNNSDVNFKVVHLYNITENKSKTYFQSAYHGTPYGRCYVIFDDKAIDVLKTYYQEGNELNSYEDSLIAGYTVDEVVQKYIELVEKANDKKTAKKEANDLKTKAKIHI